MRMAILPGTIITLLALGQPVASQETPETAVRAAIERYNRAFVEKDLRALKGMLAPDVVLYEHSVKNIGLDDVWEHHLEPELSAFQDIEAEFTDVRVWASGDVGLVTRQYSIRGEMNGEPIHAQGNETMGWVRSAGDWKLTHIHWSHPCPRP